MFALSLEDLNKNSVIYPYTLIILLFYYYYYYYYYYAVVFSFNLFLPTGLGRIALLGYCDLISKACIELTEIEEYC